MTTTWPLASHWPRLQPGQVQVWRADLAQPPPACLSPDEQARADRLVHPEARRRFLAARSILRRLLARHLDCSPEHVELTTGPRGKPSLAGGGLHFNLAHSADLALYALALDQEVGIDVETIRPLPQAAQLAARYFAPREADHWQRLPPGDQLAAFWHCWVRKEAYLKRLGQGLTLPPDQVETWPGPPPTGALCDVPVGPGYQSALAVERADFTLTCWQWADTS